MPDAPTKLQAAIVAEQRRRGLTDYALAKLVGRNPAHICRDLTRPGAPAHRLDAIATALGLTLLSEKRTNKLSGY